IRNSRLTLPSCAFQRKCDQYWPSCSSSPQNHGSYQVGLVSESSSTHFVHRILSLRIAKCVPPVGFPENLYLSSCRLNDACISSISKDGLIMEYQTRCFHYSHSCTTLLKSTPQDLLLCTAGISKRENSSKIQNPVNFSPFSAGVGRSGSYILVDSMRRHLISFRKLNLMGHLIHMRRQREKLVQTVVGPVKNMNPRVRD
ncbi:Protein-tyrosine phosphatase, partial [Ancylostoma duodenale]